MKRLRYKPYIDEKARWPAEGRAILAQYDDDSVVVYQAFSERIGHAAARQGRLDVAGFSLERMSWIKTSFLWMMHRCEWARAEGQRVVLAVWLRREAFDGILAGAVLSHFDGGLYPDRAAWQAALDKSEVRVQWDPDYPPHGPKLARRAIQIGLSGETLRRYADRMAGAGGGHHGVRQAAGRVRRRRRPDAGARSAGVPHRRRRLSRGASGWTGTRRERRSARRQRLDDGVPHCLMRAL